MTLEDWGLLIVAVGLIGVAVWAMLQNSALAVTRSTGRKTTEALHMDSLNAIAALEARLTALETQRAGSGGHTHTMSFASQHEEGGKTVLVKACQCGHVIRERQD